MKISKFYLALFVFSLVFANSADAGSGADKDGYSYHFHFDNIKNENLLFAYHFGDKQYIVDTFAIDASGDVLISADSLLPSGMYLVVFPSLEQRYFELVIDEPDFSLETDVEDMVGAMKIKGSKENKVFYDDLKYLEAKRAEAQPLNEQLSGLAEGSEEFERVRGQLMEIDSDVKAYRAELIDKYPDLLYIKIIRALTEPEIPEAPVADDGSVDSFFAWRYYRAHLFDGVDFSDTRLTHTPVLFNLYDKYLYELTVKTSDSMIVACDFLLEQARQDKEIFKFTLIWLLNEFANARIMGMDAVYVHLAENYYGQGEAWWLDDAALLRITARAKSLKPTLIGKKAPDVRMKDITGRTRSLYELENKYVILYFWDPDCSHCIKETPELKKAFDVLRETYDIEVFAVNTQLEIDKWLKFIEKHKLDFIHVADFDMKSDFRSNYDLNSTPQLFLLDKDKIIIAKRLISEQLEDFIRVYEDQQDKE